MKNKKVFILTICIVVILLLIFFIKNNYNSSKKGNNINNKSADEIKEYILNIESYKALATIKITSNKNENTYVVKQGYNSKNKVYKQEVLEPENIKGVQIIYDGKKLIVENSKLNLTKVYNEYNYIYSNHLSLISFIEDCKETKQVQCAEKDGIVTIQTQVKNENKYIANKILYIDKNKGKIEKLIINDTTQNAKIYILYNEIEINTVQEEEILAFSTIPLEENI